MTKDDILTQLDTSWANLTQAIAGIPTDRFAEPGVCGDWSLNDVLGHVAFWDRQGAEMRTREAAGETLGKVDWQAMNDADAAAKATWSFAEIETEFAAAHAAMLAAYRALSTLAEDEIKEDWEHYDEHAAEIRAWRDQLGI
jgi:uncharacterized protein (TIGR03083 family)